MAASKYCDNCDTRIDWMDLDALYRGKKVDCRGCGVRLFAEPTRPAAFVISLILLGFSIALVTLVYHWLAPWIGPIAYLIAAAISLLIPMVAPPGLVRGASWVRIRFCKESQWQDRVRQRQKRMRRAASKSASVKGKS